MSNFTTSPCQPEHTAESRVTGQRGSMYAGALVQLCAICADMNHTKESIHADRASERMDHCNNDSIYVELGTQDSDDASENGRITDRGGDGVKSLGTPGVRPPPSIWSDQNSKNRPFNSIELNQTPGVPEKTVPRHKPTDLYSSRHFMDRLEDMQ